MKKLITLLMVSFLTFISYSQNVEWKKCFGGSNEDMGWSIINSNDDGYVIAGNSKSIDGDVTSNNGSSDFWVIKIDTEGQIIWESNYGISNYERAFSITSANDGGYIIAGYRNSIDGELTDSDFWIVKINESGELLWDNLYGGSNFDNAYNIIKTNNNGYIITGKTVLVDNFFKDAALIIKIDNSGNIIWQKSFLDSDCLNVSSAVMAPDNGVIFVADDCSMNSDYIIVKLDENGNMVWQKEYGGSLADRPTSIKSCEDGSYVIVGSSASQDGDVINNHGGFDYWIIKIDSNGNLLSSKCFGGSEIDYAEDVIQNNNNELIVVGYSESNDGDVTNNTDKKDYWIINVDSENELKWEKCIGDYTGEDKARSVVHAGDNRYLVVGYTDSFEGEVSGNHGDYDYWVIEISESTNSLNNIKNNIEFSIYPNPTKELINIEGENIQEIEVIDLNGEIVLKSDIILDVINLSTLSSGLYFIKVKNDKGMSIKKFVLQ